MKRIFPIGLTALALLAGCPTTPKKVEPPAEGEATPSLDSNLPPVGMKPSPSPSGVPGGVTDSRGPLLRPLPPGVTAKVEVQRILRVAPDWLDAGLEEKARVELEQASLLEPDNKQVSCLLRGITADPEATLGGESTPYTVRAGESLGTIAKRFLGDVCEFYILARYNNIKIPKQLSAGQTIRVPGKIAVATPPPPPAPPVYKPAVAVQPQKTVEPPPKPVEAPKPVETKPAVVPSSPAVPPAPVVDPKVRAADINRRYSNGRGALSRQDLATAIREFDAVLAMDPSHNGARVYRQQAIELKGKLEQLPSK